MRKRDRDIEENDQNKKKKIFTESKLKSKECYLERVIPILKYNIWDYLVNPMVPCLEQSKLANYNRDLHNFIICGKYIYSECYDTFMTKCFHWFEENYKNRHLVHNLIYRPISCDNNQGQSVTTLSAFTEIQTLHLLDVDTDIHLKSSNFLPVLPGTLCTLVLNSRFNRTIEPSDFPTNLSDLTFGNCFNKIIRPNDLPPNLTRLTFGQTFDQPLIQGVLPPGLNVLNFGSDFNRPLDQGVLPPKIKVLNFGKDFNRTLEPGVLPQQLIELSMGQKFNNPLVTGLLPGTLRVLSLGATFNHKIDPGVLPLGLVSLDLGKDFDHPLDNVLPDTLIHLGLCSRYSHPLDTFLPSLIKLESLDILRFNIVFSRSRPVHIRPGVLPQSLRKFKCVDWLFDQDLYNLLPSELAELTLSCQYKKSLMLPNYYDNGNLPPNLRKLQFIHDSNSYLDMNSNESQRMINKDFGQHSDTTGHWLLGLNLDNNTKTFTWNKFFIKQSKN